MAPLLTIFATPKRFEGIFGTIQRNAVRSWAQLEPRPQILLLGDDAGTAELCDELGIEHVPDVECNERGIPLLGALFDAGQRRAEAGTVCFVNADIILPPELPAAVAALADWPREFLLVGQRWDLDVTAELDLTDPTWRARLEARRRAEAVPKPPVWIDYFVFRPGLFSDLPPFAVGRPGYDNWLIWHARQRGIDVVDGTRFLAPVHQNHDYSSGGGKAAVWNGVDATRNGEMLGHWSRLYSVRNATHMLDEAGRVVPARGWKYRSVPLRTGGRWALTVTRPVRHRLGLRAENLPRPPSRPLAGRAARG